MKSFGFPTVDSHYHVDTSKKKSELIHSLARSEDLWNEDKRNESKKYYQLRFDPVKEKLESP